MTPTAPPYAPAPAPASASAAPQETLTPGTRSATEAAGAQRFLAGLPDLGAEPAREVTPCG